MFSALVDWIKQVPFAFCLSLREIHLEGKQPITIIAQFYRLTPVEVCTHFLNTLWIIQQMNCVYFNICFLCFSLPDSVFGVWGCFLEMPGERRAWRSVGYKEWAKADRMRKPKTLYQSELYLSSWNALITSHYNTVTPFLASYPS